MRYRFCIPVFVFILILSTLIQSVAFSSPAAPVRLMVVSDIHYLSPSCYEESNGLFLSVLSRSDGKMTQYSRELLDALLEEVRYQCPDGLLVLGDLSFNGEYVSHQELASAFCMLQAEGIPVWVIPGNHDINVQNPLAFTAYSYSITRNTSAREFADIYAPFILAPESSSANLSYIVPVSDHLWIAMCDAAIYETAAATPGYYSSGHQAWMKKVLSQASDAGAQVIAATHQSMIPHTDFLNESMTVWNGEKMTEDMRNSGCSRLNLSGHLHIQHISEDHGIYDIATGAFSVPPFRYGMLEIEENGAISYEAKELHEEYLPAEISIQAKTWFEDVFVTKQHSGLDGLMLSESEKEALLSLAARMNHAYFRGDLHLNAHIWESDPAWALFQQVHDQVPLVSYLWEQLNSPENQQDSLFLYIPAL